MQYFLYLCSYIKANNTNWTLSNFNIHFKRSINESNFNEDEIKAYNDLNTNMNFYTYLIGNFDLMIDDIINDMKWIKRI